MMALDEEMDMLVENGRHDNDCPEGEGGDFHIRVTGVIVGNFKKSF